MDAEDKVVSEVHSFSKEEFIPDKNKDGGNPNPMPNVKIPVMVPINGTLNERMNNRSAKEEKEDEPYVCLLGSNGQVVLWCPEFETVLSRFEFSYPSQLIDPASVIVDLKPILDNDKDLQVVRKNDLNKKEGIVLIEHQNSSTLDLVGEQVWRGALFLADYILHNFQLFKNANVLEVASGVGFTSIVAGIVAKNVTITDVDKGEILKLIKRNVDRNKDLMKASAHIQEINFFNLETTLLPNTLNEDTTILLAADVVYHNQLTDAFFNTVKCLMEDKPSKVMFIALEKRYVFTIEDFDTVAPCYEHFKLGLEWLKGQNTKIMDWNIQEIATDFPQYFTYERTKDLVLWKIETVFK